jgi:hypothetical protein
MSNRTARAQRERHARNKKLAAIATLVSLFGLIAGTLAVATSGSGSSSTTSTASTTSTSAASTTTTTIDPSTFTPDGQALYALIQSGRATSYHVKFAASGSDIDASVTQATLEVWRSGAQFRQDQVIVTSSGTDHRVDIGGPTGSIQCVQQSSSAPACQRVSSTPSAPDDDVLSIVTSELSGASIASVADNLQGQDVTCYRLNGFDPTSTTAPTASSVTTIVQGSEVCITAGGVPLRLGTSTLTLTATAVETTVDPGVFDPPAPVA